MKQVERYLCAQCRRDVQTAGLRCEELREERQELLRQHGKDQLREGQTVKTSEFLRIAASLLDPSPDLSEEAQTLLVRARRALDMRPRGCGESMAERLELLERLARAASAVSGESPEEELERLRNAIRAVDYDYWRGLLLGLYCFGLRHAQS